MHPTVCVRGSGVPQRVTVGSRVWGRGGWAIEYEIESAGGGRHVHSEYMQSPLVVLKSTGLPMVWPGYIVYGFMF